MQTSSKATIIAAPAEREYNPYYDKYISLIIEPNIIYVLESQCAEIEETYGTLPDERGAYSYAEGKWTIKESLSHLIDAERIFAYRALRISRGDETPMEGFEQDGYIENSHANERSFADLKDELLECRKANLRQFRNLKDGDWKRLGTASGSPVSVRALAYMMAGHIRHHFAIHRERYL
jgi:hypothetical protein